MAVHYSEHFGAVSSATVAVATSLADPHPKVARGKSHSRLYYKVAHMDFTLSTIATGEVVRMMTFKSSDRLQELLLSSDASGTAAPLDIGLYTANQNHDGALIDVDLFCSATDTTNAPARRDVLTEATTVTDEHRGLQLWEQLFLGAGTDTVNPAIDYELAGTFGTIDTLTEGIIVIEAIYTTD